MAVSNARAIARATNFPIISPKIVKISLGIAIYPNSLKKLTAAFWEDSYHAAAVDSIRHLTQCSVYLDSKMGRDSVANHPSEWIFIGKRFPLASVI